MNITKMYFIHYCFYYIKTLSWKKETVKDVEIVFKIRVVISLSSTMNNLILIVYASFLLGVCLAKNVQNWTIKYEFWPFSQLKMKIFEIGCGHWIPLKILSRKHVYVDHVQQTWNFTHINVSRPLFWDTRYIGTYSVHSAKFSLHIFTTCAYVV